MIRGILKGKKQPSKFQFSVTVHYLMGVTKNGTLLWVVWKRGKKWTGATQRTQVRNKTAVWEEDFKLSGTLLYKPKKKKFSKKEIEFQIFEQDEKKQKDRLAGTITANLSDFVGLPGSDKATNTTKVLHGKLWSNTEVQLKVTIKSTRRTPGEDGERSEFTSELTYTNDASDSDNDSEDEGMMGSFRSGSGGGGSAPALLQSPEEEKRGVDSDEEPAREDELEEENSQGENDEEIHTGLNGVEDDEKKPLTVTPLHGGAQTPSAIPAHLRTRSLESAATQNQQPSTPHTPPLSSTFLSERPLFGSGSKPGVAGVGGLGTRTISSTTPIGEGQNVTPGKFAFLQASASKTAGTPSNAAGAPATPHTVEKARAAKLRSEAVGGSPSDSMKKSAMEILKKQRLDKLQSEDEEYLLEHLVRSQLETKFLFATEKLQSLSHPGTISIGVPICAALTFESMRHWNAFIERPQFLRSFTSTVFRLIEAACISRNADALSYWLANTSLLLFLIQRDFPSSADDEDFVLDPATPSEKGTPVQIRSPIGTPLSATRRRLPFSPHLGLSPDSPYSPSPARRASRLISSSQPQQSQQQQQHASLTQNEDDASLPCPPLPNVRIEERLAVIGGVNSDSASASVLTPITPPAGKSKSEESDDDGEEEESESENEESHISKLNPDESSLFAVKGLSTLMSGSEDAFRFENSAEKFKREVRVCATKCYANLLKDIYTELAPVTVPALCKKEYQDPKTGDTLRLTTRAFTSILEKYLNALDSNQVLPDLISHFFSQVFYFTNCILFSAFLTGYYRPMIPSASGGSSTPIPSTPKSPSSVPSKLRLCTMGGAISLKMAISEIDEWATRLKIPESQPKLQLSHILQATDVLMMSKSALIDETVRMEVCPLLSLTQIHTLLRNYSPDEFDRDPVPAAVLKILSTPGTPADPPAPLDPGAVFRPILVAHSDLVYDFRHVEISEECIPPKIRDRTSFTFLLESFTQNIKADEQGQHENEEYREEDNLL